MLRILMRILLSPLAILMFDLLILVPTFLAIVDVIGTLKLNHENHEALDIIEGIGVIMIGWGVALEERKEMRNIFGLADAPNEAWQAEVDHICHHVGIGVLVFGLFAEMCTEMIRLPDRIINTEAINHVLFPTGVAFIGICAIILLRHIVGLLGLVARRH
ncbi:MAG: hypothetical protein ACHQK9_03405 [Reyranellales bacterium]